MSHEGPVAILKRRIDVAWRIAQADSQAAFDARDAGKVSEIAAYLTKLEKASRLLDELALLVPDDPSPVARPSSPPSRLEPAPSAPATVPKGFVPNPGLRATGIPRPRLQDPITPKTTWVPELLAVMLASGRPMDWPEIYAAFERRVAGRLLPGDKQPQNGHPEKTVWQYKVDWCMTELHQQGKVENVGRGLWRARR